MVRISGVNLPPQKRIEAALPYIYGVGLQLSRKALAATGVDPNKRAKDLTPEEENKLRTYIEKTFKTEGQLRQEVIMNIKVLRDIGSRRGYRHSRGLPVRGQRTKTNSRTVRGNVRKTMGSGRRKVEKT